METKFQTSFIPRRPIPSTPGSPAAPVHRSRGTGSIFMTISSVVFVCSLLSIAGAFLWKQYLTSAQEQYKHDLAVREQQFNIDLIRQLKAASAKITLAKQLLNNHIATSKVFSIVSGLTAENVRFTNLDLMLPSDPTNNSYQLALTGYGRDLTTIAFQAKVLNKLTDFGLRDIVRNPIVSNPAFNSNGTVSFNLTASIDPSSLVYQVAGTQTGGNTTGTTASTSQPK